MLRRRGFQAGVFYVVLGAGAFLMAHAYPLGTPWRMGPGYYPAAVGLILCGLGIASSLQSVMSAHDDAVRFHGFEPLLLVCAGILGFAFLIDRAGLFAATAALLAPSGFRRLLTNPLEAVAVYAVLSAASAVLFVGLLGMDLRLWP